IKILSLLCILFIFGCRKSKEVPEEMQFMIGNYKWSHSVDYVPSIEESNYTLSIKSDGKLYTYKDGKKIGKHKIERYISCGNPQYCVVEFHTYMTSGKELSGFIKLFQDDSKELII